MNMKVYIYLILICLNVFCRLNAQQELQEMSNTIPTSYVFMLITCLKNRFLIFLLARTTINLKRQILKFRK